MEKFLQELRDLLEKHKASLYVDIDGDTHGIEENFMAEIDRKPVKIKPYSSELDSADLTEYLEG